jgi:hypothetical protein
MSTIANLGVVISARADGLTRVMNSATAGIQKLQGTAQRAAGWMKYLFAAAAGGGLMMLARSAMHNVDRIAKLSDTMGIATEDIVKFEHAAALANVSTGEMTMGLTFLARNLGNAKQGSKEAADAFKSIGLTSDKLTKMLPAEAFMEVAESIKNLPSPAIQASAAMQIFGRSGVRLLPLLKEGKTGLKELGEEAEKLGLTFSRVDAAKVEAANDALTRVSEVFQGVMRSAIIQLAPVIETVAKAFTNWATSGDSVGKSMSDLFSMLIIHTAQVIDQVRVLAHQMAKLTFSNATPDSEFNQGEMMGKALNFTRELEERRAVLAKASSFKTIDEIDAYQKEAFANMNRLEAQARKATRESEKTSRFASPAAMAAQDEASKATKIYLQSVEVRKKALELMKDKEKKAAASVAYDNANLFMKLTDSIDEMNTKLKDQIALLGKTKSEALVYALQKEGAKLPAELQDAFNEKLKETIGLQEKLDKLTQEKKDKEEAFSKGKSVFEETRTPLEKYEAKISELNELLNLGTITWDTYGRAVRAAKTDLEGPRGKTDAGTFQTIRTSLVDVKGLNMGPKDPMIEKVDTTNTILGDIRDDIRETRFETQDLA